jgi:hypothetical protein
MRNNMRNSYFGMQSALRKFDAFTLRKGWQHMSIDAKRALLRAQRRWLEVAGCGNADTMSEVDLDRELATRNGQINSRMLGS